MTEATRTEAKNPAPPGEPEGRAGRPRCLTIAQAADALQVSPDYVRSLIRSGRLATAKLGPGKTAPVRVLADSLDGLLECCRIDVAGSARRPTTRRGVGARRRSSSASSWGV